MLSRRSSYFVRRRPVPLMPALNGGHLPFSEFRGGGRPQTPRPEERPRESGSNLAVRGQLELDVRQQPCSVASGHLPASQFPPQPSEVGPVHPMLGRPRQWEAKDSVDPGRVDSRPAMNCIKAEHPATEANRRRSSPSDRRRTSAGPSPRGLDSVKSGRDLRRGRGSLRTSTARGCGASHRPGRRTRPGACSHRRIRRGGPGGRPGSPPRQ